MNKTMASGDREIPFIKEDNNNFYLALGVAVILHLIIFVIHFPQNTAARETSERDVKVFVTKPAKFNPPEKIDYQRLRKEKEIIQIPDPDPEADEILREKVVFADDFPEMDDAILINFPPPPVIEVQPIIMTPDIVRPEKISGPDPVYPPVAVKVGVEGMVILKLVLDIEGNVEDIEVLRGLHLGCTEAAVEAVKKWKFKPAYRESSGLPVRVYHMVNVNFTLQK